MEKSLASHSSFFIWSLADLNIRINYASERQLISSLNFLWSSKSSSLQFIGQHYMPNSWKRWKMSPWCNGIWWRFILFHWLLRLFALWLVISLCIELIMCSLLFLVLLIVCSIVLEWPLNCVPLIHSYSGRIWYKIGLWVCF